MEKNIVIVETTEHFLAVLEGPLASQRCISLDTETAGKEAIELWQLAKHLELEQAKALFLAEEYVEALRERGLSLEAKAHAREMRDHYRTQARQIGAEYRSTKNKADRNPGGLEHYLNVLACVQIGTDHAANGGVSTAYLIRPEVIVAPVLRDYINSRDEVLLHNAKFDYKQLKHHLGIELPTHSLVDTQAREYVLTMGTKALIGLASVLERYCGTTKDKKVRLQNWAGEWTEEMIEYAAGDVLYLFDVARAQDVLLEQSLMPTVYMEQDLAVALGDMELEGIGIDRELAALAAEGAKRELGSYENEVKELLPGLDNPNSNQQLLEHLRGLGHDLKSVDKKALKSLGDVPYAKALLKMREFSKVLSTYYEPLRDGCVLLNEGTEDEHYRIFANFNAVGRGDDDAGTDTGRLSSSNPNLQNQPAKALITLPTSATVPLRAIFVPRPGYKFVHVDLPQIEPRILAHICQDATLKKAFEENLDVYLMMGSMVYDKPWQEVTKDERADMKIALLSVMYLKTPQGMARDYGWTLKKSYAFLNGFFRKFLPIKKWIKQTIRRAYDNGYLDNICGRRRYLPGLKSEKKWERAHYERAAVNFDIQGPAAQMMKMSLVCIRERIIAEGLQDDVKLLLTVHDEVVVEVRDEPSILAKAVEIVKWGMEEPCRIVIPTVPMEVEAKVIDTWAEGKD